MNPLFNTPQQNPFANMSQMMNQFNQFMSMFRGDPSQELQKLISSGQMNQQMYQQCDQMTRQFMNMFKR